MSVDVQTPPASTPAETIVETPVHSAAIAAADAGNFVQFRAAQKAESAGKPLAPVPVPEKSAEAVVVTAPVGVPQTPEQKELSARQKKTNEAIRKAVEAATADKDRELAELRAKVTPPTSQPVTGIKKVPDYKHFLTLPGAPKLTDVDEAGAPRYESLEEHAAAMAIFISEQRDSQRAQKDAEQKAVTDATQTISAFQDQIEKAGGTAFLSALDPEVQQMQPAETLHARGESSKIGPLNVLSSIIVKSASAPQLLQYFSDHPDERTRFRALPDVGSVYLELGKVEARLDSPGAVASPTKTITSASAPPQTVSTARSAAPADTLTRIVSDTGNFGAFRAHEREKRAQRA